MQAAIWYFTDRYVLNTSDPLHDTVAAIVADIIKPRGRWSSRHRPASPSPAVCERPAGSVLGPFTVNTNSNRRPASRAPPATVTATGGDMFSRLGGHGHRSPMEPRCRPGRRSGCAPRGLLTVVLEATAEATVPSGNVYLYDGNTRGQRRPAPDPGQERAP